MAKNQYLTRFCPFCGAQLTTRSVYCETCGKHIERTIQEVQVPPYPWTPKASFLIILLVYGVSIVCMFFIIFYYLVFFGIPLFPFGLDFILLDPVFIFLILLLEIVFLLIPLAYVISLKVRISKLGLVSGGGLTMTKDVLIGIVVGAALVPLMLALAFYDFVVSGYGPPPIPPSPADLFWLGMTCLGVILVVAPSEEILFRGFVQNTLDAHYGNIAGLLVSSIIFGLVHMNPLIGVVQTIGGIFFGLIFQWRNRRLAGPIAAHATYNCLILILDAFLI